MARRLLEAGVMHGVLGIVIVLLGAPGAGKSTQAERLRGAFGLPHIEVGELLRAAARESTPAATRLRETMARGELVSDEVVDTLVLERLARPDCERGAVLDGYPRTPGQARTLDHFIIARRERLLVIELRVPRAELIARLTGRGRADDTEDVIVRRLQIYDETTRDVLAHYAAIARVVRGNQTPDQVFAAIERLVAGVR